VTTILQGLIMRMFINFFKWGSRTATQNEIAGSTKAGII